MSAKRRSLEDLLQRESCQVSVGGSEARLHPVWREKVIKWYFSIVRALSSAQQAPVGPFNRTAVHATAGLFDNYLLALPSELALRYRHDRAAYQLLATACLLIGLRLTQHEKRLPQAPVENEPRIGTENSAHPLKRAKTHRDHMDKADRKEGKVEEEDAHSQHTNAQSCTGSANMAAIPNAATILQMSAAPKVISESKILAMVREVSGSRAFPRSHVVTALDYIQTLSNSTEVDHNMVTLTPDAAEEACRLVDISLRDINLIGCLPSVVASAAITLALFRSYHGSKDMTSLRQDVCSTIFGEDPKIHASVRNVETKMIAAAHHAANSHANRQMQMNPIVMHHATAHLIPPE